MSNPNARITDNMTKEELQEAGRKGGIKSGEAKRKKKKMREELEMLMALPLLRKNKRDINGKVVKLLSVDNAKALSDFQKQNTTVQTQMLLKLTEMAMKGNLRALELITNMMGETKTNIEVNAKADVKVDKPVDTLADDLFGDK